MFQEEHHYENMRYASMGKNGDTEKTEALVFQEEHGNDYENVINLKGYE